MAGVMPHLVTPGATDGYSRNHSDYQNYCNGPTYCPSYWGKILDLFNTPGLGLVS